MSNFAWNGELAPGLDRDASGTITIAGISAEALVAEFGSPLVTLNMPLLRARADALRVSARTSGASVSYSAKAMITPALARFFVEHGMGVDVCSLGELAVAERAGIPPHRLTLHGSGKGDSELVAAVEGRVGRIVVDDVLELVALHDLAASAGRIVDVVVRCALSDAPQTHKAVTTSGDETKFGISARDRTTAWRVLRESSVLKFLGVHAHVGSQIYASSIYAYVVDALVDCVAEAAVHGLLAEYAIAGGGFGVRMHPFSGSESLDVPTTLSEITERFFIACRERALPIPTLGIEPGRSLIADAGTTLYRVQAIKQQERHRFVIVDGGLCDNPRPALYDAYHHVIAATARSGASGPAIVCGRSCENDELARVELPLDLLPGDLLAVCTTGAYTYSMASNYNRFARPAIVSVGDETVQVMTRRETLDDLLRLDG
ncbi:MAG: diaminopimelate decarboxylase [Vulcanimicrobiaceae bacterium]